MERISLTMYTNATAAVDPPSVKDALATVAFSQAYKPALVLNAARKCARQAV